MSKPNWNKAYGKCPDGFHNSVNSALSEISNREEKNMSKFSFGKKAIITVAAVMVIGVTAVAASKAVSLTGHTNLNKAIYSITDIQEKTDEEKINVKYIEEFSNGYKFEKGFESDSSAADENGEILREYKSFNLDYSDGKNDVTLYVDPDADLTGVPDDEPILEIDGTDVYAFETVFKFVPPDYVLTEQDKEDQESGKYVFSYGSEKVEIETMRQVMWQDGNITFTLLDSTGTVDMSELTAMAEEMIKA